MPHLPFTVTGPSCDSSDTMFYGVALPATIDVGDTLYIGSAGAYTLSYASAFNGFAPPTPLFVGTGHARWPLSAAPARQHNAAQPAARHAPRRTRRVAPGRPAARAARLGRRRLVRDGAGLDGARPARGRPAAASPRPRSTTPRCWPAWCCRRRSPAGCRAGFTGRTLLRGAAGVEVVLRVGVLCGLIAGLPAWLVAAGVVAMHVAAWAGFAGMRAEVTAVDPRPRAMTRYALCIAAVEAAGTGLAALLPVGPDGYPTGWPLVAVFVVYAGSLLPTSSAPAGPGSPRTARHGPARWSATA